MSIRKHGALVVCGLLLAFSAMAQSGANKQLQNTREKVVQQKAQAADLKQQVQQLKQKNAEQKSTLSARDREIARLKAKLQAASASSATPAEAGSQGSH